MVDAGSRASSRAHRLRAPLLVAAATGALSLALHLRDPHDGGSWGTCPWLALTGRYCPGCGGLRAVNDLTRGDLAGAVSSNLLLVLAVPFALWMWLSWTGRAWTGQDRPAPARTRARTVVLVAAVAVAVAAFTVLRNLPAGSWLAP